MAENNSYDRILVAGSIAYDEILDFPGKFVDYFQKDKLHQINVSFVIDRLEKQMGGTATNIAYNLSLLTKKIITLLGAVGKDGDAFLRFCKKHGIETHAVIRDLSLYTATGKAITDLNDNQIWGFYNGAGKSAKNIRLSPYRRGKSLLVLSACHPEAFLNIQRQAITYRMTYLYDPGMSLTGISTRDLKEGVKHCKWLVGNDYEISSILKRTGMTERVLGRRGISVITTLGGEGVRYVSAHERHIIPAYPVRKITDPTGAGDAWRAGFLAGIVEERSVRESLILGNAIASFAVETYGTVNHRPSRREIRRRADFIRSRL